MSKETIDIDDILRRGCNALSEAIDILAATPEENRDERWHYRNLATCVEAATHVQREQREQAEWDAERDVSNEGLMALLEKFLRQMTGEDFAQLVERARPKMS